MDVEKKKFITPEHEILHELNEALPELTVGESLRIEFLGGQVPMLYWKGQAPLNKLSERGRELLSSVIEEFYTRQLVAEVGPDEDCSVDACCQPNCCGSNF